MSNLEQRLARIEARLDRLERRTRPDSGAAPAQGVMPDGTPGQPAVPDSLPRRAVDPHWERARRDGDLIEGLPITRILGWTGASALVLAAVYLIRLALDAGWLTPPRQVALAALGGLALIAGGLRLRGHDREYASFLPAGGLSILFLAVYGAHLFYRLIDAPAATAAVVLVCAAALWLGRLFASELYGLFAALGAYTAPFLLPSLGAHTADLAIYYSAWSVLFCAYAVWVGNRRAYLVAAYLALLGFHALTRRMAAAEWLDGLAFQSAQFAIFLAGTLAYSLRRRAPMSDDEAWQHLPLLLIFYALQYALLGEHAPRLAPWLALASAAALLAANVAARRWLTPGASARLVGWYVALALFHAGYLELLPAAFAPWLALLLPLALAAHRLRDAQAPLPGWPLRALVGAIFALNFLESVAWAHAAPETPRLPALLFAVELYLAWYLAGRLPGLAALRAPALYLGHAAMMSAAVLLLDGRLAVSLAWGASALACLWLAFRLRDRLLGKSALLLLAASAAKVLLVDLSGAAPLTRVALLLVLGATLYAGGWMYRKVDRIDDTLPT